MSRLPTRIIRLLAIGLLTTLSSLALALPPAEGSLAPEFSLPDQTGTVRSLEEFRGNWLLLYFYPRDDTPGCTTEACEFRDHITVINALGAKVVGVSLDDQASHAAFAEKHQLPFALLADNDGTVSARYDALRDFFVMKMAKRYSFLIDPDGIIARRYLEVDPEQHAQQVVSDLRELIAKK